ncbi:hypothetical protein IIB97_00255 [Patescibacteria group bacterium]|nr:hypothetical protein [Patescibacteria group bacterium]
MRSSKEFKDVLEGVAQIVVVKHMIDLDAKPFVPDGWKVKKHTRGGQLEWDPDSVKVVLYLSKSQQDGKVIRGNQIREELKGRSAYNANLLDYLLAHQELIPEDWKGKLIFFWGTIYRDPDGSLNVRYLFWRGGRWYWSFVWLDYDFRGSSPAAVPASI